VSKRRKPGIQPITERAFQAQVIAIAKILGWRCYHTHDSRRSQAGFPDLVLVRRARLIFAELKSESGKVKPEQDAWIAALRAAGQKAYLWRPSHWHEIVAELSK
jgi:hypothetical protein